MAEAKKAVMIIAHTGYRDEELEAPLKVLRAGGVDVKIASTSLSPAKGMLGGSVKPEMLLGDIRVSDFDAIIFVGGSGSSCYWDDPKAHAIVKDAAAKNKLLAAICIAPVTLANAGVLDGRSATVFYSEEDMLKSGGARYSGKPVETDGNIITADGPSSAEKFGQAILKKLKE